MNKVIGISAIVVLAILGLIAGVVWYSQQDPDDGFRAANTQKSTEDTERATVESWDEFAAKASSKTQQQLARDVWMQEWPDGWLSFKTPHTDLVKSESLKASIIGVIRQEVLQLRVPEKKSPLASGGTIKGASIDYEYELRFTFKDNKWEFLDGTYEITDVFGTSAYDVGDRGNMSELNDFQEALYSDQGTDDQSSEVPWRIRDAEKAIVHFKRGSESIARKDWSDAIWEYESAIQLDRVRYQYLEVKLAVLYFARGLEGLGSDDAYKNAPSAIDDYSKAIELDPTFARAYYARGHARHSENDNDPVLFNERDQWLAIADFCKSIELDRALILGDPERVERIARAYYQQSLHPITFTGEERSYAENALTSCWKAIELKPDYSEAYTQLGRRHLQQNSNEYETAIAYHSKAIQLDPTSADAYFARGETASDLISSCYRQRQVSPSSKYSKEELDEYFKAAMADFSKAIQLKPKESYYWGRSVLYFVTGDKENGRLDSAKAEQVRDERAKRLGLDP